MAGHDELAAAREALLAAGAPVAAAEAEMLLGELAFLQGRGEDREAHHERALALVAGAPPSPTKAAVLRGAMMHLVVASRHAEGRAVGLQVLAMARELGLPDLEADALGAIGTARVEAGDPGGLDDLEAAIARFEELGAPSGTLWHLNLGWAAAAMGDLPRCFAALAAGARQAERFGSWRWRRSIELQRVAERYWTGRWAEVVAVVDALLAGDEHHYLEWECRLWRGRIHLAGGRLARPWPTPRRPTPWPWRPATPRTSTRPGPSWPGRCWPPAAGTRPPRWPGGCWPGCGGGVLVPDLGADLGLVLAELGIPAAALDRLGIPPSPWLAAARALAAGDPLAAAGSYAAIGSRPTRPTPAWPRPACSQRRATGRGRGPGAPPAPSSPRRASPRPRVSPPDSRQLRRRYRGISVGWEVSGMQRTPPRHLAPPPRTRARAREHLLVESILAVVAIGLTTAILIGSLLDRPESSAARLPNLLPPAPTTTRAAATTPSPASSRPAPARRRQPARRRRVRGRGRPAGRRLARPAWNGSRRAAAATGGCA